MKRVFVYSLACLLCGYAFLGKGFAYLHIPVGVPLYVGEIVLALGLLTALLKPTMLKQAFRSPVVWCYVAFAALGVALTLPELKWYGLDSIRDAAIYYYGVFMVLVAGMVCRRSDIEKVVKLFSKFAVFFLPWAPIALLVTIYAAGSLPAVPGSDVPVVFVKGGDVAVTVITVFLFLMLIPATTGLQRKPLLGTTLCLVALAPTLSGRAPIVVALAGVGIATLLKPNVRLAKAGLVLLVSILVAILLNPSIRYPDRDREISPRAVVNSIRSVFSSNYAGPHWYAQEGTKAWRLAWWKIIFDETILGPYFWTGRGFGENLAVAHGIPGFELELGDRPLRSPHNSHMTVLARMGVPGAVLWVLLNGLFLRSLWRLRRRARARKDELFEGLAVWLLCIWIMFATVASTDVFLEGPQGGIWFWSMMGFGFAAARTQAVAHESRKEYGMFENLSVRDLQRRS